MGVKLCWVGLTIMMASQVLKVPHADIVGGIIMAIGAVLVCLDK